MTENNPIDGRWERLLNHLDEMLLLGLLRQLRAVQEHKIEGDELILVASTDENRNYLSKPSNIQQLRIIASDAAGISKITIV